MSDPNRPARLNRGLLVVIGLVLLLGGAFMLLTGLGVLPLLRPDAVLIPPRLRPISAVPYLAALVAVVLGLLCLRWLAAQGFRRPRTGTWRLDDDPERGVTRMAAEVAAAPLITEVQDCAGVVGAAAWLCGDRDDPALRLTVTVEPDVDLSELRRDLAEHAVDRLRTALDLDELPATIQFQVTANRVRAR